MMRRWCMESGRMPVLWNCQNTHRMDGFVPSAEAFPLTTNISTAPDAAL
nr:MAG TPA: hypothetical protein [Caudoviricetes sp.]